MMFKHNKQPFADDDSQQFAYKHMRQFDCGGQLASFVGFSSFWGTPGKHPTDGERECIVRQSQNETRIGGDAANDIAASDLGNDFSLSRFTTGTDKFVSSDNSKRPFSDERSDEVAFKRARQVDSSTEIASSSTCYEMPPESVVAGVELESKRVDIVPEDPIKNIPCSTLSLPQFTCSTTEEETRSEPPVRFSFFPGYFEDGLQATGLNQPEEIYSPVFDYPPRKRVPVGPNHQADIPTWKSHGSKNSFGESDDCGSSLSSVTCSASDSRSMVDEDDSEKWLGTCVMQIPDSDSFSFDDGLGNSKIECNCPDEGSIRCVRQHVMEATEKLKKILGQDKFIALGFDDMGEVVAQKWTEEEEQLFHDVVMSNPMSLGKNFWEYLPRVFPSLSSKELVSYYFNVFMLRKRAEQSRSDPLNVDSDNDEWQESDSEFTTEEDDDDSVVESPLDRNITFNNQSHAETDVHYETDDGDDFDDCADTDEDDEELYGVSEGIISEKSKFPLKMQPVDKNSPDGGEDQDVQDDSCTSYEDQHTRAQSYGDPADFEQTHDSLVEHREYRNDDLSAPSDHEFFGGHCGPKTWEISYTLGTEKDVDFLPTSSVIEEFGNGSW